MPGEVVVTLKVTLTTGIVGKSSRWTYLLSGFGVLRFLLKRRYFSLEPDMGTQAFSPKGKMVGYYYIFI